MTDQQVVIALEIVHNRVVEFITTHSDGLVNNDTGQSNYGNLRRTASNIDNHIANGLSHVESNSDGRRHGLIN